MFVSALVPKYRALKELHDGVEWARGNTAHILCVRMAVSCFILLSFTLGSFPMKMQKCDYATSRFLRVKSQQGLSSPSGTLC